jgi:hypothetical protein
MGVPPSPGALPAAYVMEVLVKKDKQIISLKKFYSALYRLDIDRNQGCEA